MTRNALALRSIDGNVTTTKRRRLAWYSLPPQRWSWRSPAEQDLLLDAAGARYAALLGRRLHLRVTHRPYSDEQWANDAIGMFPHATPQWAAHVASEREHVAELSLADKEVYLGAQLPIRKQADEVRVLDQIMAGPGFEGRRASQSEVEYLVARSTALGAPAPLSLPPANSPVQVHDLAEFTGRAHRSMRPFGRTVRIVAEVDAQQHTRHVAVLTLGRMGALDIPGSMGPWMQLADHLGPIEWSVLIDVVAPEKIRAAMVNTLARIASQIDHWEIDHDLIAPTEMAELQERALAVQAELASGDPAATRVQCWVRAALAGDTEADVLAQVQEFTDLYLPALPFHHGIDQHCKALEFIPGEERSTDAHLRQMPVRVLAAGMPTVSSIVGDRRGWFLGQTVGAGPRPVLFNPWASTEDHEQTGGGVILGRAGCGKSGLIGVLAYQSTLAGVDGLVLDPPGNLARLAEVPELEGHVRVIDLMNAPPGTLQPFALIPDPDPADHPDPAVLKRERASARSARKVLCLDILDALLPLRLQQSEALADAVMQMPGERSDNPRRVLELLAAGDEQAQHIGRRLATLADHPRVRLIFPEGDDTPGLDNDRALLTILTMRGNILPKPGKPRAEWDTEETLGVPLLILAARLATQLARGGDPHARKFLALDEAWALMLIAAGRALIQDLAARGSRKDDLRSFIATHSYADLEDAGIADLISCWFIGQLEAQDAQLAACKAIKVPLELAGEFGALSQRERGTEGHLGYREFVFAYDRGIEVFRAHQPPAVRAALNTTADPSKVRRLQAVSA